MTAVLASTHGYWNLADALVLPHRRALGRLLRARGLRLRRRRAAALRRPERRGARHADRARSAPSGTATRSGCSSRAARPSPPSRAGTRRSSRASTSRSSSSSSALIVRGVAIEYRDKQTGGAGGGAGTRSIAVSQRAAGAALGRRARANVVHGVPDRREGRVHREPARPARPLRALRRADDSLALFAFHGALFLTLRTTGRAASGGRAARRGVLAVPAALLVARLPDLDVRERGRGATRRGSCPGSSRSPRSCSRSPPSALVRAGSAGFAFASTAVSIALITLTLFLNLYPRALVSSTDNAFSPTIFTTSSSHYTLDGDDDRRARLHARRARYQAWTYWVFRARLGDEDAAGSSSPLDVARALAARPRHAAGARRAPARSPAPARGAGGPPLPCRLRPRSRSGPRPRSSPRRRCSPTSSRAPSSATAACTALAVPLVALGAVSVARGALGLGLRDGRLARAPRARSRRCGGGCSRTSSRARPGGPASCAPARSPRRRWTGVDALEPYFARFLPQLVLGAVVPPALLVWIGVRTTSPRRSCSRSRCRRSRSSGS